MFYRAFERVCKEKKTTPCAVVTALGMSRGNITAWKKGRAPNLETLVKLANHLGVCVSKLIPDTTNLLKSDSQKEELHG